MPLSAGPFAPPCCAGSTAISVDLPWRADRDPYRVWVSEIMLQQTRVAAVLEYYRRFLAQFPNVQSLARAAEPRVLAAWSGLGYYRRARMMHTAARQLVLEHQGEFPQDRQGWQELPGIGRYTAAAIAKHLLGRALCGRRWECAARPRTSPAPWGGRLLGSGREIAERQAARRFQSGLHGIGSRSVHSAQPQVPGVSGAPALLIRGRSAGRRVPDGWRST